MVELQIVILAVAGSSPVGHPAAPACAFLDAAEALAWPVLNLICVINPALPAIDPTTHDVVASFWQRILNDSALRDCGDLEKILIGCEVIAALDDLDLLAA